MLVAAVLAILGVPVWLLVGVIGAAYWSRRTFRQAPGVFECRIRLIPAADAAVPAWPRAASYARWVHDVLLVHSGLSLRSFEALPVAGLDAPIEAADASRLPGPWVACRLRIDDGRVIELAAGERHRLQLAGPFAMDAPVTKQGAVGDEIP